MNANPTGYDLPDEDEDEQDDVCPECGGMGTDRYNDHCTDCPKCEGRGHLFNC
jgi:hypothetical protein